jgi:hypothetical protein
MSHKIAIAGIFGLLALCVGCTMCCHPYDNNGPVYDNSGQCLSNVRAGSILEGEEMETVSSPMSQETIEETASNVRQESPSTGEFEGATKMISVTDRKVEPSDTMAKSQSGDNQSHPYMAQPAPAIRR